MVLIDPQSFLSTRIDSMLITASWVDKVKLLLGLQGVSQVWSRTPTWSFWLADAPGPYELALESLHQEVHGTGPIASGFLAVKLFPYPSGSAFSSFSPEEQDLVLSDLFDETNTMRLEARDSIHPHLFTIASIGVTLSQEDDAGGLFTLEAPELSRWTVLPHERPGGNNLEESGSVRQAGVRRNVPAWDLARVLFDRLVSLHAFAAQAKPGRVVATSSSGFEVVQDEKGTVAVKETPDIRIRTLSVLFPGPHGAALSAMTDLLEQEKARKDCEVLLDWMSACACHASPPRGVSHHVSDLWWTIPETERVSHLGSTCGCH